MKWMGETLRLRALYRLRAIPSDALFCRPNKSHTFVKNIHERYERQNPRRNPVGTPNVPAIFSDSLISIVSNVLRRGQEHSRKDGGGSGLQGTGVPFREVHE